MYVPWFEYKVAVIFDKMKYVYNPSLRTIMRKISDFYSNFTKYSGNLILKPSICISPRLQFLNKIVNFKMSSQRIKKQLINYFKL